MIRALFAILLLAIPASAEPTFGGQADYIHPVSFTVSPALLRAGAAGSDSAKIGIMEFFDFQCGHCGQFQKNTFPRIKSEYIDTGKVKYFFRDFVLRSNINSSKAASIANCAGEQKLYLEAADVLFANTGFIRDGHFNALLKGVPGLDLTKAQACLESAAHRNEIRGEELFPSQKSFDDIHEGSALGVAGTPAFVIFKIAGEGGKTSGTFMRGAQPMEAFDRVLAQYLEETK